MQQSVIATEVPNITYPQAPPPLLYMPAQMTTTNNIKQNYQRKHSLVLGGLQVIFGILCIIFNIVALALFNGYGFEVVGHGFWCGVLFIITGIFGLRAAYLKTRCLIVTFMTLCIISAATTIALLTVGIMGALYVPVVKCDYYKDHGYSYYYPYYRGDCNTTRAVIAMESLLAILGLFEAVVAIWGSAICCNSGVCCCSSQNTQVVAPYAGYLPATGQVICMNQTQGQLHYSPQPLTVYPQAFPQQGMTMPQPYVYPGNSVAGQPPPNYTTPLTSNGPNKY